MKRKLLVLVAVLALMAAATVPAFAGDTGPVTCTVTAEIISLQVTDGSVAYGVVDLGQTNDTITDPSPNCDQQTITNNGNVVVSINVMSSDAVGTTPWNLVASSDLVRPDKFAHQWVIGYVSGEPTWADFPGTNDYTLATTLGAGANKKLDLKILMPTFTADTSPHTITVTVQAQG